MFLRASGAWLLIVPLAIINGGFREAVLVPLMGPVRGHVGSSVLLALVILAVAWALIRWIGPRSTAGSAAVGACWLALTIAFEFLAGHYLFGQPWEQLLADYNIQEGRVWVIVLIATFAAPIWAFRRRCVAATNVSRQWD